MKFFTALIGLIALFTFTSLNAFSQNSENLFVSPSGNFRINLPKAFTSVKEQTVTEGKVSGNGKLYVWENPPAYYSQILYYKLDNGTNTISAADKQAVLEPFKKGLLEALNAQNAMVMNKAYAYKGNQGFELHALFSALKTIVRVFIVNKRFYSVSMTFRRDQDETPLVQIMDSFSFLDTKSLIAAKIEEAMPEALPQAPAAAKLKTDAQDKNLKGKVKSVIEETLEAGKIKREFYSEAYYNEPGNLVKEISYEDDFPTDVTVWGYIDGNRVNDLNFIDFDDDQRPPPSYLSIRAAVPDSNPDAPRDTRFANRFAYKYNEKGQLIETLSYGNNGSLWGRYVYNYTDSQKEELHYDGKGSLWSKTIHILDKDGNVTEEFSLDDKGKAEDKTVYTYEFDNQGNWIVQKTFSRKIVKGKPVLKLMWTSYRKISYYP